MQNLVFEVFLLLLQDVMHLCCKGEGVRIAQVGLRYGDVLQIHMRQAQRVLNVIAFHSSQFLVVWAGLLTVFLREAGQTIGGLWSARAASDFHLRG